MNKMTQLKSHIRIVGVAVALCLSMINAQAQKVQRVIGTEYGVDVEVIRELKTLGDSLVYGSTDAVRMEADKKYLQALAQVLKSPASYWQNWDTLQFMKVHNAPEDNFRIYNWVLAYEDGTFRYHGAIQKLEGETLKTIGLLDRRDLLTKDRQADTSILSSKTWYGALYYECEKIKYKKKEYYILIGWDGSDALRNKKVVDVLQFKDGNPVFGAPIFELSKKVTLSRLVLEYNQEATITMHYIPNHDLIIFDHLVPPTEVGGAEAPLYSYVPEGTFDYFELKKGEWKFQENLFTTYKKTISEADMLPRKSKNHKTPKDDEILEHPEDAANFFFPFEGARQKPPTDSSGVKAPNGDAPANPPLNKTK